MAAFWNRASQAAAERSLIGSLNVNNAVQEQSLDIILEPEPLLERAPLTRLVATLGPNSSSVEALTGLLCAGMEIARFDFSYGSTDMHLETQRNLATAMEDTGRQCAIMLDLLGTEVVVTNRDESVPVDLQAKHEVTLTCARGAKFSDSVIPLSSRSLANVGITTGAEVFIGQYLFTGAENLSAYLTVQQVSGDEAKCICNNACRLEGRQLTVHVSGSPRDGPVLADSDIASLKAFAEKSTQHVDYVNISFCSSADDVQDAREQLKKLGLSSTRVVAKIEDRDGLINFESIIDAADGIVLSRGNMGIDIPAEKMFLAQKLVMSACNFAGKPVIIARVVDTMIEAPRPTRAEATDVANLVLDGADGILLGAETWMGRDPALTAATVLKIARQAETVFNYAGHYNAMVGMLGGSQRDANMTKVEALASSAVRAADKLHASLIVAFTSTGRTARIIAKYRPPCPVLAVVVPKAEAGVSGKWFDSGEARASQCMLYRGVVPLVSNRPSAQDAIDVTAKQLEFALDYAKRQGLVSVGDQVVVSQCPQGGDSGSVKVVQVEKQALDWKSSMRLDSTADFSHLLDGGNSPLAASPLAGFPKTSVF